MIKPSSLHASSASLQESQQMSQDSWRTIRIMAEFAEALETLKNIHPAVSLFGSARIKPETPYYQLARKTAWLLSESGFSIITGGGPGIMEAGNRGAFEGHSPSIGLNIKLPHEQSDNLFQDIHFNFNHFFSRKYMFVRFAMAYVAFPGGFGTLDEVMEALTLMQTGKSRHIPLILMGREFWHGLIDWIREKLLIENMINEEDLDLVQIIDSPEETVEFIFKFYERRSLSPNPQELDLLYYL